MFGRRPLGLSASARGIQGQSESGERTAFVLAGGGSLGAVQLGMLAELIGAGVRPDVIVVVSAGALNGAFLVFDPSLKMVEQMAVLWSRMTTKEVLGLSWRSLLGLLGLRDRIAARTALPHVCPDGGPATRDLRRVGHGRSSGHLERQYGRGDYREHRHSGGLSTRRARRAVSCGWSGGCVYTHFGGCCSGGHSNHRSTLRIRLCAQYSLKASHRPGHTRYYATRCSRATP